MNGPLGLDPSDADLVTQARDGNRDAWATLCRRHARRLAAYLGARLRRPKVVDKLVEDAVVTAWRHLDELERPDDFAGWYRRVGAGLALQWYREHSEESLVEPFPAERCGGDAEQLKRMTTLEEALGALTDPQRMALEQRYRAGLSGAMLYEAVHLDAGKADRLVEEALAALERALERDQP